MNGIDAVAIATGNDWRSIEAGAHAFAASAGRYSSLTRWTVEENHLLGSIELPMAVGTVGGSTRVRPIIKVLRELLGTTNARELAMVMAAVGLAQNLGSLTCSRDRRHPEGAHGFTRPSNSTGCGRCFRGCFPSSRRTR